MTNNRPKGKLKAIQTVEEFLYRVIKIFVMALGILPRIVQKSMADLIGIIWFKSDKRHCRVVAENISMAFPDKTGSREISLMTKQVFKNIALIPFEVGWCKRLNRDQFSRYFTLKGLKNIKDAHEKGKGVIAVSCHMSNWELLVAGAAMSGFNFYGLYRKLDFQPLERFMLESRQRLGTIMIPLGGASRKLDGILKNKGVVATLLDQNMDWYQGVYVNFFGRPACTHRGVASLAIRTGAPVIPFFIARENKKFVIEFGPEIPPSRTGDITKDIEANTQNYTKAIEAIILRHPDQWFWVHNRWKTKNFCPWPRQTEK